MLWYDGGKSVKAVELPSFLTTESCCEHVPTNSESTLTKRGWQGPERGFVILDMGNECTSEVERIEERLSEPTHSFACDVDEIPASPAHWSNHYLTLCRRHLVRLYRQAQGLSGLL